MPLIGLVYGTRPIWIKWLLEVPLANGGRRVRFLPSLPLRAKADMRTFWAGMADGCSHACTGPKYGPLPSYLYCLPLKSNGFRLKEDDYFLGPKSSRGTFWKHNHLLWWYSHILQMKRTNLSRCGGGVTEMAFLMVSYLMVVLTQR